MGIDPWYDPTCSCCTEKREEELQGRMSPLELHLYSTLTLIRYMDDGRTSLLAKNAIGHVRIRGLLNEAEEDKEEREE